MCSELGLYILYSSWICGMFFFFKQKTAYEMRISDWSSDVCSSDLPALVLNADYTPLSYYPLSVWPWQTAVKAVFLDRVDIVDHYEREVRSPTARLKLPSVIALKQYVKPSQ